MTTVKQQKEMFYAASRQAVLKQLSDFIDARSKQRFQMVKEWHLRGKIEEEWATIEQFDAETDKQEAILEDLARSAR